MLETLPVGGTTPLAHGLDAAGHFLQVQRRRQPRQPVWLVLLTDGRTNVPLRTADPWQDALEQARLLAGADCLVVDTETHWPRFGRAALLAEAMGAGYMPLESVLERPITDHWKWAV